MFHVRGLGGLLKGEEQSEEGRDSGFLNGQGGMALGARYVFLGIFLCCVMVLWLTGARIIVLTFEM